MPNDEARALSPRYVHATRGFWLVLFQLDAIFAKPLGIVDAHVWQHHLHYECLLHLEDLSPLQDLGREPTGGALAALLVGTTTPADLVVR